MMPSVIFWAIILGVIAFWAFAETLLVRGVAGLWRSSSAGIVLKLLATVLVIADLAFGIYFFWTGILYVPAGSPTANECTTIWTAAFTWGNVLCLCMSTAFSPILSVLLVVLHFLILYYDFAWESLVGEYWTGLLLAFCRCVEVFIVPFLRAWLMWRISGKSLWKTGVVLLASWLPPVPFMSAFFQLYSLAFFQLYSLW